MLCGADMENVNRPPIRFGIFEVDLRAGELRRQGVKIRLQQQPFQILAMLLEHPGEVVTREEIQKRLWPADTFVDFNQGLNRAANRLRESLGDDADNPRYIETLPRRGYRFVAPVQDAAAVRHELPVMAVEADAPTHLSRARLWTRKGLIVASAAVALLVLLAGFAYLRRPHLPNSVVQKRVMASERLRLGPDQHGQGVLLLQAVPGRSVSQRYARQVLRRSGLRFLHGV